MDIDDGPAPAEDFFVGDQAVGDDFGGADFGGSDFAEVTTEGNNEGGGLMMDYFDQSFLKNWAGPEHWKLRKVVRRPEAADAAAAKPKREKKEAFKIDFLTPAEKGIKELSKELFAPVTRGRGLRFH
ncbi:hypothetical protein A0H81_05851 [Grifola frondosa]|uniref:Condensin complex subunit 2 n=1 Tax=Grifola frondosa TaxID=5627 RepID=A0A1C7MCU3_GRIFR|nr:hypothetical protein A0H81_05851 [Grifola frondosa]